jgi:uncharacterized membrane protein
VSSNRLEAFSDAVIAILMTIMVLELRAPEEDDLHALREVLPDFLAYVLSFVYLGIYWNNHHHMLQATERITGGVLWANLHLLFWLSLFPFTTDWIGQSDLAHLPTAAYGVVMLMAALAYYLLQTVIIRGEGPGSTLAEAIGRDVKGKLSPVLYATAIGLAFVVPWASVGLYVVVALMWLVPDRRLETRLAVEGSARSG